MFSIGFFGMDGQIMLGLVKVIIWDFFYLWEWGVGVGGDGGELGV